MQFERFTDCELNQQVRCVVAVGLLLTGAVTSQSVIGEKSLATELQRTMGNAGAPPVAKPERLLFPVKVQSVKAVVDDSGGQIPAVGPNRPVQSPLCETTLQKVLDQIFECLNDSFHRPIPGRHRSPDPAV